MIAALVPLDPEQTLRTLLELVLRSCFEEAIVLYSVGLVLITRDLEVLCSLAVYAVHDIALWTEELSSWALQLKEEVTSGIVALLQIPYYSVCN
jgi:hypothetical protein